MFTLRSLRPGDDVVEFCGGTARTTHISIRRHFKSGGNWDLITGADLNEPETQGKAMQYFTVIGAAVAVMAPRCPAYGPPEHVNYVHNYEDWHASYLQSKPHAEFRSLVAKHQLSFDRDFLVENPHPSWMYEEGR